MRGEKTIAEKKVIIEIKMESDHWSKTPCWT